MEIFYNIIGWVILVSLVAYTVYSVIKTIIVIKNRIKSNKGGNENNDGSADSDCRT